MTKEHLIREYVKDVDFKNISISKLKEDLHKILHEIPHIELEYNHEIQINEVSGEEKRIESLGKLKIYYTNINSSAGGLDVGGVVEFIM